MKQQNRLVQVGEKKMWSQVSQVMNHDICEAQEDREPHDIRGLVFEWAVGWLGHLGGVHDHIVQLHVY